MGGALGHRGWGPLGGWVGWAWEGVEASRGARPGARTPPMPCPAHAPRPRSREAGPKAGADGDAARHLLPLSGRGEHGQAKDEEAQATALLQRRPHGCQSDPARMAGRSDSGVECCARFPAGGALPPSIRGATLQPRPGPSARWPGPPLRRWPPTRRSPVFEFAEDGPGWPRSLSNRRLTGPIAASPGSARSQLLLGPACGGDDRSGPGRAHGLVCAGPAGGEASA